MAPVANRNHFHCRHCGNYHFPAETGDGVSPTDEPTGLSCPVCVRLPLQVAFVEGEPVCYCDHCRGFLMKAVAFAEVVTKRRRRHGPQEQRPDPFDHAELGRPLSCPSCRERMDTHPYFGGGNAVVDTCEPCGLIWLDAGELAVIERYIPHVRLVERPLDLAGSPLDAACWRQGGVFDPLAGQDLFEVDGLG
jgi:Zn-finger nucleic acid-binding protein